MGTRTALRKSSNPMFSDSTLQKTASGIGDLRAGTYRETMTVGGAVNKTMLLTGILILAAIIGFQYASQPIMLIGAIGGLIMVLIAVFRPQHSRILSIAYAGFEGVFVGAISAVYASFMDGIILQAVSLTVAVLVLMLLIYKSGLIKVTQKFRMGVMMATGAIFVVYLASFVLSFFGISVPYLHEGGAIGIGISLVIIGVASLNLLLDFDNFEKGEQYGAPQYMEWFFGMGLLVTLVWLYLEILRLLAVLNSSD